MLDIDRNLLLEDDNTEEYPIPFPVLTLCEETDDFKIDPVKLNDGDALPILVLRNMVLFPGIAMPILVGRTKSLNLVRKVAEGNKYFGVVTQKDVDIEDPKFEDLYNKGTIAEIVKLAEMPDGTTTAIIQGHQRFSLQEITQEEPYLMGKVQLLEEVYPSQEDNESYREYKALISSIKDQLIKLLSLPPFEAPAGAIKAIKKIKNSEYMINLAASSSTIALEGKQNLLECDDIKMRGLSLMYYLQGEYQMLELKANIQMRTHQEMDKQQREYFLQQQIKTIQDELGGSVNEIDVAELQEKVKDFEWPESVEESFERELMKLERLAPQSPDYAIQLQYLQTLTALPWGKYSDDDFNINKAQKVLDRDHHGLEKVKERIIEQLAVFQLNKDIKSPIICLFGPPGVGKTSLGKSIADSMNREYVRISLGGVHDEAEIRGHRKTYIGAMPGRIIKGMLKAKTMNPVFILDEIDKIGNDFKGDPSSALLEVLDPEQNSTFHDNYLDIPFDLSKVLFIATANSLNTISQPLLDRMELIEVNGYITEEKIQIARKHLIPKQIKENGLQDGDKAKSARISFTPKVIEYIVENYTRESGVRALDKAIATICRKQAVRIVKGQEPNKAISIEQVQIDLGAPKYSRDKYQGNEIIGVVTGLAWTRVGGEILFIEASLHKSKQPKLTLTGNLGDVMKESAIIAWDYIKAHREELNIEDTIFDDYELHIHVPEGAVPKDGPSAGITMVTAIVSTMTKRKVKNKLAMTGEMTLRGKVLPVGGIREKILAAKRSGITDIILCKENKKDIDEINNKYLEGLTFHYVETIDQVLDIALI
ncbi:endopeptidase La [Falsiporphyromonas endometrii]|uniref:Lon protease n=1 Tax=Falsiporphyromonas endometrii TaxID=1387297 RepID=A0ABV9K7Y6_9PORP